PAEVRVMFSPGCGLEIDLEIARRVRAAQRRVRICSLLINSGTLIGELGNLLRAGRVAVDGIYDRTQMAQVYLQWQEVPQNRWKISALKDIIARAGRAAALRRRVGRSTFDFPMAETSTAVIASANNLSVKYGAQVVLDGATIAFREGEHIGLVGRNGSGKSTFLQIAAGVAQADSGE